MQTFRKYFLPGFIFQSLIIGGGYGTGREIVEFFLKFGPLHGLWNMLITTIIWSVVLALCFELCRIGKNYNYQLFIKDLLGKFWIIYDVLYIFGMILVLSVMGSASGDIINQMIGLDHFFGVCIMMFLVSFMVFKGSVFIEKIFSYWSIVLYCGFGILFILAINNFSIEIIDAFQNQDKGTSLWKGGVKYAAYNIGLAPAIFFCTKHLKSKNEAIFSGLLAGVIGILPAFFMYISMLSFNSDVIQSTFPVNIVLDALGYDYLKVFFQIILFGTFIETGASLIHGLNQRVFDSFSNVSNNHRITFSLIALVISIFLSEKIGLIKLISNGYGMITWGYWLVFVIPVLIIGSIKIFKK